MTKSQLEKKYDVQIHDDMEFWRKAKKTGIIAYKNTESPYNAQELCRANNLNELAVRLEDIHNGL